MEPWYDDPVPTVDGSRRHLQRRLILIASALAFVSLVGTAGYTVIEGWPPFESFYMTVITVTTVGYGEVHPLSRAGKLFTVVLIVMAVSVVTYVFTSLNQLFIEHWLGEVFWRSGVKGKIANLKAHYILCGCGRVGRLVRREFEAARSPFVVIEADPLVAKKLADEGVLVVEGNATEDAVLEEAGIARAAGLISTLPSDADNLFVSMTARGLNSLISIVARASEESVESKLIKAGADRVISPNSIGGRLMAHAMLMPEVVEFMRVATDRSEMAFQLEQVKAERGSILTGSVVGDFRTRHRLFVMAMRKRDGKVFDMPSPESVIEEGDTLIVLGRPEDCRKLLEACGGA